MRLFLLAVLAIVARPRALLRGVRQNGMVVAVRLARRLAFVLRVRAVVAVVLPRLLLLVVVLAFGVVLRLHATVA